MRQETKTIGRDELRENDSKYDEQKFILFVITKRKDSSILIFQTNTELSE